MCRFAIIAYMLKTNVSYLSFSGKFRIPNHLLPEFHCANPSTVSTMVCLLVCLLVVNNEWNLVSLTAEEDLRQLSKKKMERNKVNNYLFVNLQIWRYIYVYIHIYLCVVLVFYYLKSVGAE